LPKDNYGYKSHIAKNGREAVDLPILALSSYAGVGDREKSLAAGMSDHLTKPIDPGLLDAALRADRREDAIRRVHAIRGVAGSLGGKEMEAVAAALEQACRAAENIGNFVPFALGGPLRVFIDCHETLITAIGAVLAGQSAALPAKHERPPGTAAELCPLLKQLKMALASKKPLPCKKILEALCKRRWSEGNETALTEINRLVQHYRLAEALAYLNKEFNDVMKNTEVEAND
jgi:HPt (histidine-containing phosphotransfer) domain-containing protein